MPIFCTGNMLANLKFEGNVHCMSNFTHFSRETSPMNIAEFLDKILTKSPELGACYTSNGFLATAFQRRAVYRHHPGATGVDPTRFGDWEYNGRCTDFS